MDTQELIERPKRDRKRSRPSRGEAVHDRRLRLPIALIGPVGLALLGAMFTPRGAMTMMEALATMAAAVAVGGAAGYLLTKRWSLLLAPVAYVAVFETLRLGLEGPTVDRPDATLVGVLVWVGVRVLLGIITLVPMALGARWGVELAARRGRGAASPMPSTRRFALMASSLALVGIAAVLAVPARTAAITGPDGTPAPGSVAELTTIEVNGQEQALMIRGADTDNPVLLHLAGGPGGTDIGAMRLDTSLEEHFMVVTWDQRGTGKSVRALDPTDTLTLQGAVDDTLVVTDHLRERFGQDRIVITGQSWGTIPAVLAAQAHPERFRAVVATGQMVSPVATDRIFYDDTLAWADARDDAALRSRLLELGPPPYDRYTDYLTLVGYERDLNPYPEFDGHTEMTATIWVPEYDVMERFGAIRGLVDTYSLLYPQLQQVDFRTQVPRLEAPVYVVMGEHEARGRVEPAREWFETLDAPAKEWVEFPASSHRASFERPSLYTDLLTRVLDETSDRTTD
jgi:proline iminopeptidase